MESLNINLENFQSIGDANLEFVPGFNLIVGQTNSGKTAILRAVNSLINNPTRGKCYIKKGNKTAEVTINFEGNEIKWTRTNNDISYTVNGELFKKAGRNTLFDFKEDNGFVKDDEGNIMNIEGEWNLPFPFDRTPSELFKLFENVFCISDSATILKSFKDAEGNVVKEKLALEDKFKRINKKVEGLEELASEVNLDRYTKKLDIFKGHVSKYKELSKDLTKITSSEKYSKIQLDEVLPPSEESVSKYLETVEDFKFLARVVKKQKFYKSLPDALIIGDTIDKYVEAKGDYDHLLHAKALVSIDLSKECQVDGSTLENYLDMKKDYEDIQRLREATKFDILKECNIGNTIEEYEALKRDYEFIEKCYKKCKELKAKYAELEARIDKSQSKLDEYKVCPLCGHELGD